MYLSCCGGHTEMTCSESRLKREIAVSNLQGSCFKHDCHCGKAKFRSIFLDRDRQTRAANSKVDAHFKSETWCLRVCPIDIQSFLSL